MIAKLFYRLFKKTFLKQFYLDQSFTKYIGNMNRIFVDSNGMEYYSYEDDFNLPVVRFKEIEKRVMQMHYALSDTNIDLFCDAMEKALNSGRKAELGKIGALINELRKRKDILLHPDLMFDLVAFKLIRKDENPAEINMIIHAQKVEQFKKDSLAGLYDFFHNVGLLQYMPYLENLKGDLPDLMREASIELIAAEIWMKDYITEPKSSKPTEKITPNT